MKKRIKPYTHGNCLDDALRALKRLYARDSIGRNDLYAVCDAAMRTLAMRPRDLRTPNGGTDITP